MSVTLMNLIRQGASASFTMVANNVGKWALECKVNDHYMAGMKALYDVASCGSNKTAAAETGVERKFFIGIIETDWNYADSNKNILTGDVLDNTDRSVHDGRERGYSFSA